MVEMIRAYWMQQAEKADSQGEDSERTGAFAGFVLLSDPSWDKAAFIRDLQEKWDLTVQEDEDEETGDDTLVFEEGKMIAAVSLMAAPIPNGEAELNAENNFLWPEAVDWGRRRICWTGASSMSSCWLPAAARKMPWVSIPAAWYSSPDSMRALPT